MKDYIKLNCGCKIGFSDTYPHLIVIHECCKDDRHRSITHSMVSTINDIIDIRNKVIDNLKKDI